MSRHQIEGAPRSAPAFLAADQAAARDRTDAVVRVRAGHGHVYAVPRELGTVNAAGLGRVMDARRGSAAFAKAAASPSHDDVATAFASLRTGVGEALAAIVSDGGWVYVFGDYDVDGVASCTAMALAIADMRGADVAGRDGIAAACAAASVIPVVPERTDGYGLSARWVRRLASDGASRIVCVDNGTNALDAMRAACALGLQVLVVDHHPPSAEAAAFWSSPPDGLRICNPFVPGPFASLLEAAGWGHECCASLVVEALAREVSSRLRRPASTRWGMVLAGLATVTDVMPLHGANRALTSFALRACDAGAAPPPILALAAANLREDLPPTPRDGMGRDLSGCALDSAFFGFHAGPRLNACGRIGSAEDALDYLMSGSGGIARGLDLLERSNDARRAAEDEAWDRASDLVRAAVAAARPSPTLAELVDDVVLGMPPDLAAMAATTSLEGGVATIVPGILAVVALPGPAGVAGLLAGRIAGALGIPALALSRPAAYAAGACECPGSGRVPDGSPFRALAGDYSLGHALGDVASAFGGGGGGHAAAFGVRITVPGDSRDAEALVADFAVRLASRALNGLAGAVLTGSVVPFDAAAASASVCDAAVPFARLGAPFAKAVAGFGPFGAGLPEPLIHVRIEGATLKPIGERGSFLVEARGSGPDACKVVGFARSFGGGLASDPFLSSIAGGPPRSLSAVGRLRQSFFGRNRSQWSGPRPEFVLDAITDVPDAR